MVSAPTHSGVAMRSLENVAGGARSEADSRRSGRDWLVDVGVVVLAVAIGLAGLSAERQRPGGLTDALLLGDVVLGSAACLALGLRRRRPVELAVVLSVVAAFSAMAGAAALIALFTVAVHRPSPRTPRRR